MADIVSLTAFKAILNEINTLCLREFPCGTGSWHKTDNLSKSKHWKSKLQEKDRYENLQLGIATVNADKKISEELVELITDSQSPWYMDYNWSQEAKSLREIAIKSPWLINPDFVYSYFRTLNIVDKAVTEIDEGLLRFKNLEEITLSANYITTVNTSCLPASLKVLELCANEIDDITDLCNRPPPLQHLGLGRNRISRVGDCISGTFWPHLVSLDLSHNDLCGLTYIVNTFSSLSKLRDLNLQGNPISLIPGYRGYIIDFLQNLTVLDDKQISVDEKYNFNGLAKLEELVRDEAVVQLGVVSVSGLQCPPEIMHPENQPDYPVIERSYFVQFMLPTMYHATAEKIEAQSMYLLTGGTSVSEMPTLAEVDENVLEQVQIVVEQSQEDVERTQPEKDPPEKVGFKEKAESEIDVPTKPEIPADVIRQNLEAEVTPQLKTEPVNSKQLPWETELNFHWAKDVTQSDLLTLRNFFKTGMDVHVVEQTVEAYLSETGCTKVKYQKEKDKEKEKKKTKEPEKPKERAKKKRESTAELVKCPPTFTNIASFHVPLESFLNGEYEYENNFTKASVRSQTSVTSKISEEKLNEKPKRSISSKSPSLKKDRKKSLDLDRLAGKRKHYSIEDISHPLELQLLVTVKLGHWMTARDAVTVMEPASTTQFVNVVTK